MFHFSVAAIKKLMIEHCELAYMIPVIWMEPVSTNINHKGLIWIVAIDSCFALLGARQYGVTTRENSGEKYPRTLI